jgi:thioredoxin
MNTLNSILNAIVLVVLCVAAYFFLMSPKDYGPPPSDNWFRSAVTSRSEPVLVKFGADWCGPCRMMDPELDRLEGDLRGHVSVVRVNVDQHPDLAQHYGISSIPRLMLFRRGQVVADRVGYADRSQLQEWIAGYARN